MADQFEMTAKQALKAYRRRSQPILQDGVRDFNRLALNDRIELLYWMLLHTNMQVGSIGDAAGADTPVLEPISDN